MYLIVARFRMLFLHLHHGRHVILTDLNLLHLILGLNVFLF